MTAVFGLSVFALLYWGYPFDGMTMEESWALYTSVDPAGNDLSRQQSDLWSWPFTRRGGYRLLRVLMASIPATPVLVNGLCIVLQLVNLTIFASIVVQLIGSASLFPILMVAVLYPFTSSGHFWQASLVHHLAAMFFLISFALFLRACWFSVCRARDFILLGVPGLICFWLSLSLMEHATLLPLLLLYLALYKTNGRSALLKFTTFWSPAVGLALCYLALSAAFILLILSGGHSRLNFQSASHATRFAEWATSAHIPPFVVVGAVVGTNAILFFLAATLANSIGYLGYPLLAVIENAFILVSEPKWIFAGVGLVALTGTYALYVLRAPPDQVITQEAGQRRFLLTIGLLWVFLCYAPLSLSFAYPRVIGQTADRINVLALYGVSLCWGVAVTWLRTVSVWEQPYRKAIPLVGFFLITAILLLNLYLQREYWVEAYRKERQIVVQALQDWGQVSANGRRAIVLFDRSQKPEWVRSRLNRALHEPNVPAKLLGVAKVVIARHFTEAGELEVTSFQLRGIPLFGAASDATYVFSNYARQLSLAPVLAYKIDYGVTLKEDEAHIVIEDDREMERSYSKTDYRPVLLSLGESYFQFRGASTYRVVEPTTHQADYE